MFSYVVSSTRVCIIINMNINVNMCVCTFECSVVICTENQLILGRDYPLYITFGVYIKIKVVFIILGVNFSHFFIYFM